MIDIESIKNDIVEQLQSINPKKIILFGSYAYGTPNANSDIDICIIKDEIKKKLEEKRHIRKLLNGIDFPKDILLVENDYFLKHSGENWINTAYYDIRTRGEVLYEKK